MQSPYEEIVSYVDENIVGLVPEERSKLKDYLEEKFNIERK